uniref:Calcium uniporter protein n=1 Tax=Oncorhynchus kisutch TaxID=8019 RepID=A0A8C7N584_ONCKI
YLISFLSLFPSPSLSLTRYFPLFLSLSPSFLPSLSRAISLSFSPSLHPSFLPSLAISLPLPSSLSLYLFPSLSSFFPPSLSLSLSLSPLSLSPPPQGWSGDPSWHGQRLLCTSATPEEVTVVYQNGLPVISVSLPSRRERCQFTLKPLSDCVGVFLTQLQTEDRGIDRVAIYSTDGARVASSTGIDILLLDDFNLVINNVRHLVRPPRRDLLAQEEAERLNDVKFLVQQLYTTLRIEEHQLSKEKELVVRLEDLNSQLRPLEKVREELSRKAERRTTWVLWGGVAYMATQFGILARLTWWEYSWDIMEPVTYFITYATAMAMYSYYVLTRQEYIYPDARDRQYLLFFHKGVKRQRFDLHKYNLLKDSIAEVELDLKRLRDPLQLQLPVQQLTAASKD